MSIATCCRRRLLVVLTPHHVARNVDGSCLIICDSISKSFVRLSRHRRLGPDAFSSRPSKYLSREQHFSASTVCVNALYKSRDGACALRYSILAARKDFAALPTRQTDGTGDDFVRL